MDGFDEISPTHADKAVILSQLMQTKVQKVWVTSRPVLKEKLEKALNVTAFSMKKMSHLSQENVFKGIWKGKVKEDIEERRLNEYVKGLPLQANALVYQKNFTGCPFYISIIASVFVEKLDISLRSTNIILPQQLNLLKLYEKIVDRKLRIYETEKKGADLTKASVQDDYASLKETTLETLYKCSLLVTLPSELNPLSDVEKVSKIHPFIERVQYGKDKIGIVMNAVNKKPHFVHRSIAEYFTAHWLSGNFESNRRVLERIFCDSAFGIVRNVFNRILAGRRKLHCAVLDWDIKTVKTLLEEGSLVNAVDSGGRTALHLIAAQGPGDSVCAEITKILLDYNANVETEDLVLQWIPLRYATETKNKFVEGLLSD
jgi:hypothetical protein